MPDGTLLDLGLVLFFVLLGGVFAATEIALVSLRETQLRRLESRSARGAQVASLARDPNRFLSAVQIGVTLAGFLSAAFGASRISPVLIDPLRTLGLPETIAPTAALVLTTLVVAYFSLVLGELVPKRLALQKAAGFSLVLAPPLGRFATAMTPVIWLLSLSTNLLLRVLGGDPRAAREEIEEDEIREMISSHAGIDATEREIVDDVFSAGDRALRAAMRPRRDVVFLDAGQPLAEVRAVVRAHGHSRYPVTGRNLDDIVGYLHVRDLLDAPTTGAGGREATVADLARDIVGLPSTLRVLPALTRMRDEGAHIAVVVDEYGGTDGIVTLEDLIEELIGDIRDEYDAPSPERTDDVLDAGLGLEEFAERTGVVLEPGPYETVAGYVVASLGRLAVVGDRVPAPSGQVEVTEVEEHRVRCVRFVPAPPTDPSEESPATP